MEISLKKIIGEKGSSITKKIFFVFALVVIGLICASIYDSLQQLNNNFYFSDHRGRVENRWNGWLFLVFPIVLLTIRWFYVKYVEKKQKHEYILAKYNELHSQVLKYGPGKVQEVVDEEVNDYDYKSLALEITNDLADEHTSMSPQEADLYREKVERELNSMKAGFVMLLKNQIKMSNKGKKNSRIGYHVQNSDIGADDDFQKIMNILNSMDSKK